MAKLNAKGQQFSTFRWVRFSFEPFSMESCCRYEFLQIFNFLTIFSSWSIGIYEKKVVKCLFHTFHFIFRFFNTYFLCVTSHILVLGDPWLNFNTGLLLLLCTWKISLCIDLNLEDEILQLDYETTLKQEITWAFHLSLKVCIQMMLWILFSCWWSMAKISLTNGVE